jgi:hypothetical protein
MWDFIPLNRSKCVGFGPSKSVKLCGTGHLSQKTTKRMPRVGLRPILIQRSSREEFSGSKYSIDKGSVQMTCASSNLTPCFSKLLFALFSSQVYSIIILPLSIYFIKPPTRLAIKVLFTKRCIKRIS